jgi:hypothetical protein
VNEAATYLQQVVYRVHAILGVELLGVYAGGSFALQAYMPERSDLDVAAVCLAPLPSELKTEIAATLCHESLPCPARGLEFVLYPESNVRGTTAGAGFELNLNTGRAMVFTFQTDASEASSHWYVIDRAILREHGRALFGPPAHELFAAIPRATLLRALSESVRWHSGDEMARDDDAVLNACRAWRFAAEGVWSSKRDAGNWAYTRLDDPDVVTRALEEYSGDGQLGREQVDAFLRRILHLLESAT